MVKIAQMGIAVGLLGVMIALMGMFPSMIGRTPTPGFGVIQILIIWGGMALLILGAMIYVKFAFYAEQETTLAQQIGTRIALTGLTFTALIALADVLGFGSNLRVMGEEIIMGPVQMWGILGSFGFAALGVIVFALAGDPVLSEPDE